MNLQSHESPLLTERFREALAYTYQLHARQIRKGSGIPYISHLLSVAALVLEDGGTEDEAIAALLHDAVEDQGGESTRLEIQKKFGSTVVAIIDGCTESRSVPKPDWHLRKQQYLVQLTQASAAVQRVSLADKLHNARSILADQAREGDAVWARFKAGREGTLWFYRSFVHAVSAQSSPMLDELRLILKQLGEPPVIAKPLQ